MTEIALFVELMLVFATFLVGLVLIRLACHQASRYAVDYADMLASTPQDVRDLRAQYLREQRTRIDRLLARVREFRERHARWPDPRELACRDRDTHDSREDS
jgi:maltodextrin utilization protein YvdJ